MRRWLLATALGALWAACAAPETEFAPGGGGTFTGGGTSGGSDAGAPDAGADAGPADGGATAATIQIYSGGATPSSVVLARGGVLTFQNLDVLAHTLRSDPHPAHGGCPELNLDLGLSASVPVTFATGPRTCRFHDEARPADAAFQGEIQIR